MKGLLLISLISTILLSCNKEETPIYVTEVLPPPVENFTSGTFQGQFTLFWDYASPNQINYFVLEYSPGHQRDTIGAFENYYQIPDIVFDTSYFFLIRAVDKKGNYSTSKSLRIEGN